MDQTGNGIHSEVGKLQQKTQRQQHAAALLQTAHNRTLRRLKDTRQALSGLMRIVEAHRPGENLAEAYAAWCVVRGILTPDERALRRFFGEARAARLSELSVRYASVGVIRGTVGRA